MLLDAEMRAPLQAGLAVQEDRAKTERLLLRLDAGAATERLWLSYPRLDVSGARPRVPSFYVLDVMRAVTGRIPNHEVLQREAAAEGGATLDWPAPRRPETAIDDVEHDLATLGGPDVDERSSVRGTPTMLGLNDAATVATRRWAKAQSRWRVQDGLIRAADAIADAASQPRRARNSCRRCKFATCPYQFALSAIHRLSPTRNRTAAAARSADGGNLPQYAGSSARCALRALP